MKYIAHLFIVISLLLIGCSAPTDERATALCDCYKELHRIDADTDFELMNVVADSCKNMHIGLLKDLEGKPAEKEKFDAAYEFCQNEK